MTTDTGLPRRPGEPSPGDVGKKGGDTPNGDDPIVDQPTDLPPTDPNPRKGPIGQPAI